MSRRTAGALLLLIAAVSGLTRVAAEQQPASAQGRFLSREEIRLYGLNLTVAPPEQVVPKDMATIVSTFLQTPTPPAGQTVSPFAPDAEVRATLRGPSLATPVELAVKPGNPFNIPALKIAGVHTLENIRLVSNGDVLLRGTPESARIEVIEKLLVTQVTARALTADEIREAGIVFDKSNFQAYNFAAAFAIQDTPITVNFPVLLPRLAGAEAPNNAVGSIPGVPTPAIPQLATIIPDTLKLQTRLPNLQVVGFSLKIPQVSNGNLIVPPIPGIIAIPGDIGFLNQYFSVMLMVGNVAPEGSGLVVSDLSAQIVLPPGRDNVPLTPDDPLRMALTARGEVPAIQIVAQAGPDAKLGTADDIRTIGPGQSGNAEYLVEGRREGSHIVEMRMTGTLNGLPVGPVAITGTAVGSVLVRNPTFALTFTHPEIVSAGETYNLDVTVTNTSASPANFVSINLEPQHIGGARLVGDASQPIESIAPGDSATVSFALEAKLTGRVFAATFDADEGVSGRFALKTSVGELGVPLSPDSLVLPTEAGKLPKPLRDAAIGLLGKAWAVATSPPAALPAELTRFSRKIVLDRAVEVAEAGLRVELQEPIADSAAQLALDFIGSNFPRLPQRITDAETLAFEQNNYRGFDLLRRLSVRGDIFADAVAALLRDALAAQGPAPFHRALAEKISYRPGVLSVLAAAQGALPVSLSIADASGRRTGGVNNATGKVTKAIPFSDLLRFTNGSPAPIAEMALVAAPANGTYTVRLTRAPGSDPETPFILSIVVPDADGDLRHIVFQLAAGQQPAISFPDGAPYRVAVEWADAATTTTVPSTTDTVIADPAPTVVSVIQRASADQIVCDTKQLVGPRPGRIIAVLFSEEVTALSVHDKAKIEAITNYTIDGNAVVGVALQPGRRIAYLALRDPFGPLVERSITFNGIKDLRGHALSAETRQIVPTVDDAAGVVTGQVLRADGTPAAFANVRLFYRSPCNEEETMWTGISSKTADGEGRFSWDFVLTALPARIVAVDADSGEVRDVRFHVRANGQRLNVNLVFLGRGTLSGRTLAGDGRTPLVDSFVRVISLTDQSQYSARTDNSGRYTIAGIPVGNIVIDAVNTTAVAQTTESDLIPFAGATTTHDLVLFDATTEPITIKRGNLNGFVIESEGQRPAVNVPVIAYYQSMSQPGVACPRAAPECAVAVTNTDEDGHYNFPGVVAGSLRLQTFNQSSFEQGQVGVVLAQNQTLSTNIVLAGGLGTVRGVVIDPSGKPVVGAQVGGGLSLTTTDGQGRFTLTDVPVGYREIVAASATFGSRAHAFVNLLYTGQEVNATLVLDAVASVSGMVTKTTGAPAAGLQVYVIQREGETVQVLGSATTDDKGGYRIDRIPVGEYRVSAFTADFSDGNIVPAVLKFHGQVVRADLKFRGGGGRVTGRVFAEDGATPLRARVGISGEQVVVAGGIVGVEFRRIENFRIVDTNLTTGRYSASGIFVGPFTVRAAGAFSPDPVMIESAITAPGQEVQVDLRLQPTSQLTGTVFMPDGQTPVGANVAVHFKSDAVKTICTESNNGETTCESFPQGVQNADAVTDTNGTYLFPVLNAGKYTVTVDGPGDRTAVVKGTLAAGQQGRQDVRLLGKSDLTVRVRAADATTPIPGARVDVSQVGAPNKRVTFVAGTDGVVTFTGADAFSEGEIVVVATDLRNGATGRARGVLTSSEQPVAVDVFLATSSGVVFGRVVKPDGLTPVPNAEVVVTHNSDAIAFAITGEDGRYREVGIPLGDVRVDVFEAATGRRGSAAGQIATNGVQVELNVVEQALGVVRGQVVAAVTLQPLRGWRVTLGGTTASGRSMPALITTSGLDGSFSFPGTPLGNFTINASKPGEPGSGSTQGSVVAEGELVEVPVIATIPRLAEGRIEGTVVDHLGGAIANARVEVRKPGSTLPVVVTADGSGRFTFGPTSLGRHTVRASRQGSTDSGTSAVDVLFDGQTAATSVVLNGLSTVTGVVTQNNAPVPNARVTITGQPSTGCDPSCSGFAGPDGTFKFERISARSFTVVASDANNVLRGSVSDLLNPGETKPVVVTLEPTRTMTGRTLSADDEPRGSVVAEVAIGQRRFFAESNADGTFAFDALPLGNYRLELRDATGPGQAVRLGTIANDVPLGDIRLDEAPPRVLNITPLPSAVAVPRTASVTLRFSEAVERGSIGIDSVQLAGPSGPVVLDLPTFAAGDTEVVLKPTADLQSEKTYTVTVNGVRDRAGRSMPAPFSSTFTTVDVTAPTVVAASPQVNASGVSAFSTIRIQFSEPVVPPGPGQSVFEITQGSSQIEGRTDYILGNTVAVFTPNMPLAEDSSFRVRMAPAVDLSGNPQAQGLDYTFTTTDRTPPSVLALVASGDGTVIENGTTQITANVGTTHDVLFVDFFLNDRVAFTARTEPFQLRLQAVPSLGAPGSSIKVSAFATDSSGNRSVAAATLLVPIRPDMPPAVALLEPASGGSVPNGSVLNLRMRATDDLGLAQVGYRVTIGGVVKTGSRSVIPASPSQPPATDTTQVFEFQVPASSAPGATVRIEPTVIDLKGQAIVGTAAELRVLDAAPPDVAITGVTSGASVRPGQSTTVVVSASDPGLVRTVTFTASGAVAFSQTRTIDPAQASVAASFTFTVPAGANATQSVTLAASAVDATGNLANAAAVVLPVADIVPPTITLRTSTGTSTMVPGSPLILIAEANDQIGVGRIELTTTGAVAVAEGRTIDPPASTAEATFTILVPDTVPAGATLQVQARARDAAQNISTPASLTITAGDTIGVKLPASLIVNAGVEKTIDVALTTPAGPAGVIVDLSTENAAVATVTTPVQFAQGETAKTATVTGKAGGSTALVAKVQDVERARMTVTVQGGIVTGIVRDPQLQPVAGAQVTVEGGTTATAISEADGRFTVQGITGPSVRVKALDADSGLYGVSQGTMAINGFLSLDVVLIDAGSVSGVVRRPNGDAVGAGTLVSIFTSSGQTAEQTVFTTIGGAYEFPLVAVGSYRLDASDAAGNLGRTTVNLAGGQQLEQDIVFLGRGTVRGVVLAAKQPVASAELTFRSTNLFGTTTVTRAAGPAGEFEFTNVFAGTFTIDAVRTGTGEAGSASGSVPADQAIVDVIVNLSPVGTLAGTVRRSDQSTVSGATVSIGARTTTSDDQGHYSFAFLPAGAFTAFATVDATREKGTASGTIVAGQTTPQDIVLVPQGRLSVTVTDADGAPVNGAGITVSVSSSGLGDTLTATTGSNGQVLVDRVMAGSYTVTARFGELTASASGTLAAGETRQVALSLQAVGTVTGIVYLPGGQLRATGGVVSLIGYGNATIQTDGRYTFTGVRAGTFDLWGYDEGNRRRAAAKVTVPAQGGEVTRDLEFVGVGTVKGRVLNGANGVPQITVTVESEHPDFGHTVNVTTDNAGFYQAERIVFGPVAVSAGSGSLRGETRGTLDRSDVPLTLDILLTNNATTLPKSLFDANGSRFDMQMHGGLSIQSGGFYNAFLLDIVSGGQPLRFNGEGIPTLENDGREVATRQNGLGGLNVTRKLFVPKSGYFGRWIEILSNPTSQPITVDVRLTSVVGTNLGSHPVTSVISTSSGDAILDVASATPDRWLVVDDATDADPNVSTSGVPAVAFVFDGAGAAVRTGQASHTVNPSSQLEKTVVQYTWQSLTVPAGESVALVHFGVRQMGRAQAAASAERLVQLPPEALAGLNPDELPIVRNFVVPADGNSALLPLPAVTGTVSGRVLAGDASTPIGGVPVKFKSDSLFYGRTYTLNDSTATGTFELDSVLGNTAPIGISIGDPFTLTARHHETAVDAPPVHGSFPDGADSVVRDVVFTGTGLVQGVVKRHNNALVTSGTVTLSIPGHNITRTLGASSSFLYAGLPAGDATLKITHNPPGAGGTSLTGTAAVTVVAGQKVVQDIIVEPTGAITGAVKTAAGGPASGVAVRLERFGFFRERVTDTGGNYTFSDVPLGAFTVSAIEPATALAASAPAAVAVDTTTTMPVLTLIGYGTIDLQVTFGNGNAVGAGVAVQVTEVARGASVRGFSTNAQGKALLTNVTAAGHTIKVLHPADTTQFTQVSGTLTPNQTLPLTIALPGLGSVTARLRYPGPVVPGVVPVELTGEVVRSNNNTNSNGDFTFTNVPANKTFSVRGFTSSNKTIFRDSAPQQLTADGQSITVDVTLPALATLAVTVKQGDQLAFGTRVAIKHAFATAFGNPVTVSAGTATASFANTPEGVVQIRVTAPSGAVLANAEATITADDHGDTVPVTVQAAVTLPRTLTDANGFLFDVAGTGRVTGTLLQDGIQRQAYDNGLGLQLFANDTPLPFTSSNVAQLEANGRELAIAGADPATMAGLEVTRKVFVPATGYFARYLEVLRNPTTSPITVDVEVASDLHSDFGTVVVDRIDGRWIVTDDDNGTQPWPASDQALAHVFSGQGGRLAAPLTTEPLPEADRLAYRWDDVTIAPGETVILMHYAVQQPSRNSAQASAVRLAQLPPEALVDLSAPEIAAVANFDVPDDGVGTVTPLLVAPAFTVSGQIYTWDGTTLTNPRNTVTLRSSNPVYSKGATVQAVTSFNLTAMIADGWTIETVNQPPPPFAGWQTSRTDTGTIVAGATSATKNVVFAGTGSITGRVRLANDAPVTSGSLTFSLAPNNPVGINAFANGAFSLPVVPAGAYTMSAVSSGKTANASFTVTPNAGATVDLRMPAVASVRVHVSNPDGSVAPNPFVTIVSGSTTTSQTGTPEGIATFANIREGDFQLQVYEGNGGRHYATATGTVLPTHEGAVVDVPVQLKALARLQVTVLRLGVPVQHVPVYIRHSESQEFDFYGYTSSDGRIVADDIPAGFFEIRVRNSDATSVIGSANGTVPNSADGQLILAEVILSTDVFAVEGQLLAIDGATRLVGYDARVVLLDGDSTVGDSYVSDGTYQFADLPRSLGPALRVRVYYPSWSEQFVEVDVTVGPEPTTTRDVTVPVGGVLGKVRWWDGSVPSSSQVMVRTPDGTEHWVGVDEEGRYGVFDLEPTDFEITAWSYTGITTFAANVGTLSSATEVVKIDLTFGRVRGKVTYADGSIAPNPAVFVKQTLRPDLEITYDATQTFADGTYEVIGPQPGDLVVTAQKFGLEGVVPATIAAGTPSIDVDIQLEADGPVAGAVLDAAGSPVSGAQVALSIDGLIRQTTTDGNGQFGFEHVRRGTYSVQASAVLGGRTQYAAKTGLLTDQPASGDALLQFPPSGAISGQVIAEGGGGAAQAQVIVESPATAGPLGSLQLETAADGAGFFAMSNVPSGQLRVSAFKGVLGGWHSLTLSPDTPANFQIQIGSIVKLNPPYVLDSGAFRFDVQCQGAIARGGRADGAWTGTFSNMLRLQIGTEESPCIRAAAFEDNRRELALDAGMVAGLQVTRKIYVPPSGGFARYLEVLTNTTAAPRTVFVRVQGVVGTFFNYPNVVVFPSTTGNRYGVINIPGLGNVGFAIAGGGAAVAAADAHIEADIAAYYSWEVTVPAGQTVILMHFVQQDSVAPTAATNTQALALGTRAGMLDGMSAEEIARVVNFKLQ